MTGYLPVIKLYLLKAGLNDLEHLNLASNMINSRSIQSGSLRRARSLKKVEMMQNNLDKIPQLPKSIEILDLSGKQF